MDHFEHLWVGMNGDPHARTKFLNSRLGDGRGMLEEGRYGDAAQAFLIHAEFVGDTIARGQAIEVAQVCATLALGDKIQEATATLREVAHRQIDAMQENTATLGQVIELRRRAA